LASLDALKRDASNIEAQWEIECQAARVEICRYRLLPSLSEHYAIAAVTKSLLDFQELFSQIYDALKNGVKKRARISGEIIDETAFEFGFSYPGSLGIALILPNAADLIGRKFETAVDAFMQVLNLRNEDEVKDLARALGDAVVKKIYDWSSVNYISGYSVDITWNTVDGLKKGGLVDAASLGRIAEIIRRTSDAEHREFRTRGTLVAIDTVKKRFRFVEPDGVDYSGALGDAFPLHQQWTVNMAYAATISVDAVTEYATQKTEQTYKLLTLADIEKSK
jgi:hypothetical protein